MINSLESLSSIFGSSDSKYYNKSSFNNISYSNDLVKFAYKLKKTNSLEGLSSLSNQIEAEMAAESYAIENVFDRYNLIIGTSRTLSNYSSEAVNFYQNFYSVEAFDAKAVGAKIKKFFETIIKWVWAQLKKIGALFSKFIAWVKKIFSKKENVEITVSTEKRNYRNFTKEFTNDPGKVVDKLLKELDKIDEDTDTVDDKTVNNAIYKNGNSSAVECTIKEALNLESDKIMSKDGQKIINKIERIKSQLEKKLSGFAKKLEKISKEIKQYTDGGSKKYGNLQAKKNAIQKQQSKVQKVLTGVMALLTTYSSLMPSKKASDEVKKLK